MLVEYTTFKYLYPPRPIHAISPCGVGFYEKMGWVGQFKKNGTSSIIAISPEKIYIAMTRHATLHKAWQLTDHIKAELTRLFSEKVWIVLIAEVLHSKTKSIKDTIFIYDIIVWDNTFLLGSSFSERQNILESHLVGIDTYSHKICDQAGKIWYAKCFTSNFLQIFDAIEDTTIDEGLVLKDPNGKLRMCDTPDKNAFWQVKIRHPSKNYQF